LLILKNYLFVTSSCCPVPDRGRT